MDELVTDLSIALDRTNDPPSAHSDTTIGTRESPSATPVRKAPKKRRVRKRRSDYPPLREPTKGSPESNDSVEEALKDYIENITMCQSDSEDEIPVTKRLSSLRVQLNVDPYPLPEKGESDSVSEPFIGLTKRRNKRKRKLKRMSNAQALSDSPLRLSRTRKRKVCGKSVTGSEIHSSRGRRDEEGTLADIENGLSSGCGEPMDTCASSSQFYKLPTRQSGNECNNWNSISQPDDLEEGMAIAGSEGAKNHSSNSDDSDLEGFFTNDEGRLGDDEREESSFEHEVKMNAWWEEKSASDLEEEKFQRIVNGVMDEYRTPGASSAVDVRFGSGFQGRLKKIQTTTEQEVTLGHVNKNMRVFLQDEKWTELSILPSSKLERAQVYQWASLYSLHCQTDPLHSGRLLLRKTSCSTPPKQQSRQGAETKRRRKLPPLFDGSHFGGANPIPPSNIGNQMLRVMGWTPGTGLGADRNGIVDPVKAYMRPRGLGLGHPWH